jgi:hypothetical protein
VILSAIRPHGLVKTWAQVIAENRARMKFFQESLQITVTKEEALRHLKEGYANIFKDTPVEAVIDDVIGGGVKDEDAPDTAAPAPPA